MAADELTTGWMVEVTTPPDLKRYFIVAEPNADKAVELAKQKIPVHHGEQVKLGAKAPKNELIGQNMKPGDVKQHV